jgi:hypothetical protein
MHLLGKARGDVERDLHAHAPSAEDGALDVLGGEDRHDVVDVVRDGELALRLR